MSEMIGTTNAFPIVKYRILLGIPAVQLSGKPFNLSHSIGVKVRNRLLVGSRITWELRFKLPSLVSIVLPGRSRGRETELLLQKRRSAFHLSDGVTLVWLLLHNANAA